MSTSESVEEAVEALRQFGLREYESKCFVGLLRLSTGTAKEISEMADVPRTRVYDAVRVLEARGLVTTQHSSPKRFRAVTPEEATRTFRERYERELERLSASLEALTDVEDAADLPDVWTMTGRARIDDRIRRLTREATEEIVFVVGDVTFLTEEVIEALTGVSDDVSLLIGGVDDALQRRIRSAVPRAETFVSGLEWLADGSGDGGRRSIGRLLLIDRSATLISTVGATADDEHAMYGAGLENGLVVVARRLLARDGPLTLRSRSN
ncbi:TrmB family transcriptional regulator [Halopenitus persicus]|uniref:Sugar-specific transcriptional regulator TrmB n=1 Tax=Halopenitus persicus TaxID=1048396 RepID=A0A1H3LZP8_9EURY|nr:helix-turn-helix domain-containing protein [Halopenitus persicus]QHS18176.1 TrmB family transcriptional regulator [haloarchaeon 3A1-DGR]SDY70007.1 Sugar-specific transcriptional regulator TrmB [Halopenitus persicus]